jgi:hypothetical protein
MSLAALQPRVCATAHGSGYIVRRREQGRTTAYS